MTLVDLFLIVGAAVFGWLGHRLGLLAAAAWLIGATLGVTLGGLLLGWLLGATGPLVPLAALVVTVVVLTGSAVIGSLGGLAAATQLRQLAPVGKARSFDTRAGAVVGVLAVVVATWALTPSLSTSGSANAGVGLTSGVARGLGAVTPPAPDVLGGLRARVGDTRYQRLLVALNPDADPGPPPPTVDLPAEVRARVGAATFLVEGQSCQRMQDGTAFVVGDGVLVTNAHVVAGVVGPVKLSQPGQAATREATVTLFDSRRDLALLRMRNTPAPVPLADTNPRAGSEAAVFGHPDGDRNLSVVPARVDRQIEALGRDLYRQEPTRRQVLVLSSRLRPGFSGGPVVNTQGRLVGVAFAVAPDRPHVAYALTLAELKAALAANRDLAVPTGDCVA